MEGERKEKRREEGRKRERVEEGRKESKICFPRETVQTRQMSL